MDNMYWFLEYGKVFMAYGFLMFIWPSAVFRKLLKGRSLTFYFGFCATASILVMNTTVLLFGLLHILNRWTIRLFFYGLFLFSLFRILPFRRDLLRTAKRLVRREYGLRSFLHRTLCRLSAFLKRKILFLWSRWKPHFFEYSLLFILVVYGLVYFSWGPLTDHSYGFSDSYTHHTWSYNLTLGKIFSSGVYPEGMHCVVYTIHTLFGLPIQTCNLFLGCIHIMVFIVSAYCLFKEVFGWRGSSLLAVLLFLILKSGCLDEVYNLSRLQCTLPQEFGFFTMFICPAFFVRYLKSNHHPLRGRKLTKHVWDENLIIFCLALADSLAIHFYVTIFAFFMCAGFALFHIRKIFRRTHFLPLVIAAVLGVVLAVIPMVGALASGMRFQGSINWALSVMSGSDGNGSAQNTEAPDAKNPGADSEFGNTETDSSQSIHTGDDRDNADITSEDPLSPSAEPSLPESAAEKPSVIQKLSGLCRRLFASIQAILFVLYGNIRSFYILLTLLACILFVSYRLIALFLKRLVPDIGLEPTRLDNYVPMLLNLFFYLVLYAAPYLGLPELIQISRLCSTIHILFIVAVVMSVDTLFYIISSFMSPKALDTANILAIAAVYTLVVQTGNYHSYLYFALTRYNVAVDLTEQIMAGYPRYTYTIISPNEELHQVMDYGRHEDLYQFIYQVTYQDTYYIPTEYLFIYIEKRPMLYAQTHFFSGPGWLADNYDFSGTSVCPEIICQEISDEMADELYRATAAWPIYTSIENRTILESRAYRWCAQFAKLYTHETEIYYEDENFICYRVRQNPLRLFNMVIQ